AVPGLVGVLGGGVVGLSTGLRGRAMRARGLTRSARDVRAVLRGRQISELLPLPAANLLAATLLLGVQLALHGLGLVVGGVVLLLAEIPALAGHAGQHRVIEIGRASCRERV